MPALPLSRRWPLLLLAPLVGVIALACRPTTARSAELNVAVAANFADTLRRLGPEFERQSGDHLHLTSGASGQFYAQIQQGAPFDVLLSADAERPERLEREGLAVPSSRFTYALGTLVLWSAHGPADQATLTARGFRVLAIANPDTAPYGAAAKQVLQRLHLWDPLTAEHRLVTGESIGQAWQFASTGAADLGFVALSQALEAGAGHAYWIVPESLHDPIAQQAVILTRSAERPAAQRFLDWLRRDPHVRQALREAGYRLPP